MSEIKKSHQSFNLCFVLKKLTERIFQKKVSFEIFYFLSRYFDDT